MDRVATIMSRPDETTDRRSRQRVRSDDEIRRAVELMLDELVEALLVTDADGLVVGVVTWHDVVAWAVARQLSTP